jgi:hypothetical protein
MNNSTTTNDEQTTEEKKTAHSFFSNSALNKAQSEFTTPTHERDDITPFYVLGYN